MEFKIKKQNWLNPSFALFEDNKKVASLKSNGFFMNSAKIEIGETCYLIKSDWFGGGYYEILDRKGLSIDKFQRDAALKLLASEGEIKGQKFFFSTESFAKKVICNIGGKEAFVVETNFWGGDDFKIHYTIDNEISRLISLIVAYLYFHS